MNNGLLTRTGSHFFVALFVACLALSSLVVSCMSAGMSCDFDSNCDGGELCVDGMCADPCTSDQQCAEEYDTCQVYIRENEADQVHICMSAPSNDANNATSLQCTTDEQCHEALGSVAAICGLNYRCVVTEVSASPEAQEVPSILIRDRTPRVKVDEQNHPGTIVSAVFVRDAGGSIVGYGNTLEFVSGAVDGASLVGHLDGQPVELDESGQCVSGNEAAMSPLGGEGGYYLVGFVDYRGEPIALGQGWKVIVIGWSSQCSDEADPLYEAGEYDVSLCVSSTVSVANFDADCQKFDGEASGYAEFLVTEGR